MTIRRRFALIVALQTAVLLLALAGLLFLVLQRFLVAGEEERLEQAFAQVEVHEGDDDHGGDPGSLALELDDDFPVAVHVRLVRDGVVLDVAGGPFPDVPLALPAGFDRRDGHQLLVRPVRADAGTADVQLAVDRSGVEAPLRSYLQALGVTVPIMMIVAALAAALTAGRLLAPLRALERATRDVAEDGPGRLRSAFPHADARDELGALARTLQTTFRRLDDAMTRERDFVRAAAHDLRSPLTALSARIQGALARPRDAEAYREELRELGDDVRRMSRLAEHLLLLARDATALQRLPVDLADLAGRRVDRARSAYPDVDVDVGAAPQARVLGDAALLAHLLDNLLENAVVHGRGAPVRVEVETSERDVLLRVADEGPGAPPGAMARLRDAFFRGDPARAAGGSGLGLAIVERIAEVHGATVALANREPAGFEVVVRFPAAERGNRRPRRCVDAVGLWALAPDQSPAITSAISCGMSLSENFSCSAPSCANAMMSASSWPVNWICRPSSAFCIAIIAGAPRHIAAAKSNGFIGPPRFDASSEGASVPPTPLTE